MSVEAIVIVSLPAVVVIVTLEPAANVKVSVVVSATTSSCPDTDIVLKEYSFASPPPPEPEAAQERLPLPSVVSCWPFEPSAAGNT